MTENKRSNDIFHEYQKQVRELSDAYIHSRSKQPYMTFPKLERAIRKALFLTDIWAIIAMKFDTPTDEINWRWEDEGEDYEKE